MSADWDLRDLALEHNVSISAKKEADDLYDQYDLDHHLYYLDHGQSNA